jgi:GNAT superfamily N-acetyltransferase
MEEVGSDLHPVFEPLESTGSYDVPLLGVEPTAHGQGLGSALLTRLTAGAARAGRPVTLWTVNPGNVGFYKRNGFEVLGSGAFCDGALPWWALSRPVRTSRD